MAVPGAAPPPERLAEGPSAFGPLRLVARIAGGRRTSAYLGHLPGDPGLRVLRVLRSGQDRAAFEASILRDPESTRVEHDGQLGAHRPAVVGESLATVLDLFMTEGRALPMSVALTVAMGIAARLEALGTPHGDLVPHHVLLGFDGTVHLLDPAGPDAMSFARVPGRAGYRAPEHVDGHGIDSCTDIFLLGVLLFEMTTGTRLFDTEAPELEERIRLVQVPRPRDVVGDGYPIELQLVLRKLTRPSRAGRFPTPRAAQDALRLVATTRADVGPGPLSSWLRTELADRQHAWADVADLPGAEPAAVRARAPSRAQTRPASFLGAGAPTIEELRLDSPALEAVRRRIVEESQNSMRTVDDDLREELAALKLRRTELPAIPPASTEPTSPGARAPRSSDDTYEELDVPTPGDLSPAPRGATTRDEVEPPPAEPRRSPRRPQGLASSPPPNLVPELPTEVTRRFPPLPAPLTEVELSDAATSLDEIEPVPGGLAELELFAFEPAPLATPPAAPAPMGSFEAEPDDDELDWAQADAVEPRDDGDGDLDEELAPEALMIPNTDRRPTPLELGWSDGLELEIPATPAPAPAPVVGASLDDEPHDDTLQDEMAGDLLGADALARLERAVEVLPAPTAHRADSGLSPTMEDDDSEEVRSAMAAVQAALRPAPSFVGSEGGASGEARVAVARPRRSKPSALGDAPVDMAWASGPPDLGLTPEGEPGQAAIPTQVVRNRVVANAPEPSLASARPTPAPLNRPPELTPTPLLELHPAPPPEPQQQEETSSAHLVIPISDAELAGERPAPSGWRRPMLWSAAAAVLLSGAGVTLALTQGQTAQEAPTVTIPVPTRAAARAPAPRPTPPPEQGGGAAADAPEPPPIPVPEAAPAPDAPPPPTTPPGQGPAREAQRVRRAESEASGEPSAPTPTWTMRIRVLPETARILVDGRQVPNDTPVTVSGNEPVRVNVSAEGYAPIVKVVSPGEPEVLILMRKDRPSDPEENL